ncbi:MAG: AMIN domain-containing protein [Desulfobacterales bacterium]|jgi:hypothetical protein|nr:AMIN domain-containing protein [Desulfobacterales bacterium]
MRKLLAVFGGLIVLTFFVPLTIGWAISSSPGVRGIILESHAGIDIIHVQTSLPVEKYQSVMLDNPKRVAVDLLGGDAQESVAPDRTEGRFVRNLRMGKHPDKVRIAANLPEDLPLTYSVVKGEDEIEIRIAMAEQAEELDGPEEDMQEEDAGILSQEADEVAEGDPEKEEDVWGDAPPGPDEEADASNDSLWEDKGDAEGTDETATRSVELTGLIRHKIAFDMKEDNNLEHDLHNHSEVQLGVKYVPNDRFHAILSMDADYFVYGNDGDWDYDDTLRLHNAFVNWSGPGFNVKAGNQIVRWGKTDGYSPLDNVNPEDYREGIAGRREDRKLPIPILNLEWYHGKSTLQGIYLPVFVSPALDREGADWAFFQHADKTLGAFSVHEQDPSFSLRNSEAGIRLSGTVHRLDYAFSWFHTREDLPAPDSIILPGGFPVPSGNGSMTDLLFLCQLTGQPLVLKHDRQNIYGFELETIMGDFGIRGDVAYFDESSYFTRELKRTRKPLLQYMAGIDYNGEGALYANLQLLQNFIINYDDRITGADEVVTAVTGSLSKEFFYGHAKPEFRFYYDFSGNAFMLNPKLILNYFEPLMMEFGAEVFYGTDGTIFEVVDGNDLVYAVFEINF